MNELIEILENITTNVGSDWKNNVLIDDDTDNPLVKAYNEGVQAMANQVCCFMSAILSAKATELKLKAMKEGDN